MTPEREAEARALLERALNVISYPFDEDQWLQRDIRAWLAAEERDDDLN